MKRILFLQTLLLLFLCSSFSFAKIHYVSNQGSSNGNGSLTNPFNKISTAYNAAVSNGQNDIIKLMPGNYYETNILIFDNEDITISGYGDQSVISNNIIVKSNMSFEDLQINSSSFSNEAFVLFDNVKCDDANINVESISGTWRGNGDEMHINFLSDPNDDLEVVNYQTLKSHTSNYVAEAGLATENDMNTETAAREAADNLLSADIISAMGATINTISGEYLKLDGGTLSGDLTFENNVAIRGKNEISSDGGKIIIAAGSSLDAVGGDIIINAGDGGFASDNGGSIKLYAGNSIPETRAEMTLEGGKHYGDQGGISTKCSFFRVNDIDIVYAIDNAMSAVQKSGDIMAGTLATPNINLIPTIIEGYLVSGIIQTDMNGLYIITDDIYNGQPVYKNNHNWVLYSNGGGFWQISNILGGPMYDYGWSPTSPPTVPLSGWMFGSSVSVHTQTNNPTLNFAAGRAINLHDGVDPQDAVTISQLGNEISATKNYIDNSVSNVISGNYVKNDGDIMSGSITFTNRSVNGINYHYEHWKTPDFPAYRTNRFNLFSDGNNLISSVRMWQTNSGCGYWWKLHTPIENNGNWYDALWLTRRPEYSNYTHNTALRLFHPLLMNNEQIHFLADPSDPQDAATKAYIDDKEFSSANISIGAITETKIASGAITTAKLASDIDDRYVNADGDTMNGTLKMGSFNRHVFKFNHVNQHAIGVKNSDQGNVLSFFANNIFHFNTISEDAETTQIASLKLEIRPDYSQFFHTLNVSDDVNVSGTLTVPQINITGSSDWKVGSANQRADIVIKNPNSEIRSENGDVIINAAANKIVMKSKVKFSADQFGSATIPTDFSTISVTDKNVSSGAVILLTPCGEVSGAPYAQINADGTFDIKLSEAVITPTVINYLILEK